MSRRLNDKTIAVLATTGFEQVELTEPVDALRNEGATVHIVSPESGQIKAWDQDQWGKHIKVDVAVSDANADDYHALLIPGGVMNPDSLRQNNDAVEFVRTFFTQHKPMASICHGPWMLVEADVVRGRKLTSYPSIKTDLKNAGANWVDEDVVVDEGLVTSRNPGDLEAFNKKVLEELAEGKHERQVA